MRQKVAPTCLSIKIVTSIVLLLTAAMFVGALFDIALLWAGIFLTVIVLLCYQSAPIAYELNSDQLTVIFRMGKKVFGPVLKCSIVGEDKPPFSVRLWGNGGLFAGTGIFWNKKYGVFRAYVSTGDKLNLVLVETPETKVIISPERPGEFLKTGI
jgi:hypothetical protein